LQIRRSISSFASISLFLFLYLFSCRALANNETGHLNYVDDLLRGFARLCYVVSEYSKAPNIYILTSAESLRPAVFSPVNPILTCSRPERESLGIAFAFLSAVGFGHAQYLSITYIQFGADQTELGIAGGLGGVARESGGAIAVTTFQTILVSVQTSYAARHVVPAAVAAGASQSVANAVASALPLGAEALGQVQGVTTAIATAAGAAFTESYVQGLK
jgi:hypothetical protein